MRVLIRAYSGVFYQSDNPYETRPREQRLCSVDGCGMSHSARGFCKRHYKAWYRKEGILQRKPRVEMSPTERFWSNVDQTAGEDGCWIWKRCKSPSGYGIVNFAGRNSQQAHRISWEITSGPIPDGLLVCHDCPGGDNPACVNPRHLFLGTYADNSRDMKAKRRSTFGERNARAKLKSKDIHQIVALLGEQSQASIARQYGVSQSCISLIASGKRWEAR